MTGEEPGAGSGRDRASNRHPGQPDCSTSGVAPASTTLLPFSGYWERASSRIDAIRRGIPSHERTADRRTPPSRKQRVRDASAWRIWTRSGSRARCGVPGSVAVETEEGCGSSLTVRLPLDPPSADPDPHSRGTGCMLHIEEVERLLLTRLLQGAVREVRRERWVTETDEVRTLIKLREDLLRGVLERVQTAAGVRHEGNDWRR